MHDELAHLSTSGENRLVPGSGHYVQFDKPQAVVDAVAKVVGTAGTHYR
jgi:pimeloyl-ACP methyl ester carboxylesterase